MRMSTRRSAYGQRAIQSDVNNRLRPNEILHLRVDTSALDGHRAQYDELRGQLEDIGFKISQVISRDDWYSSFHE